MATAQTAHDQAYATAQMTYESAVSAADTDQLATMAQAQTEANSDLEAANVVFDQAMTQAGDTQITAVQQTETTAGTLSYQAWLALNTSSWNAIVNRAQSMAALIANNNAASSAVQSTFYATIGSLGQVPTLINQSKLQFYQAYLSAAGPFLTAQQNQMGAQSSLSSAQTLYNVAQATLDTAQAAESTAQNAFNTAQTYLDSLETSNCF